MTKDTVGTGLHEQIEHLVEVATGKVVTVADLRASGGALDRAGVNSIGYINLMEALEQRFGVVIDPEADPQYLVSIESIAQFVRAHS
ncbi:acyl carrier protein [Streptomyces fragilis]|uniref:Acyl carrier protein n=1 Tax=Streptomyces fragilis TaxID=67301 RepID=A0ABV2YK75_9ACTN|nr:acyl carrier protein [Streptomyces fragilis]